MSLATGASITDPRWTSLPMPREVIQHVNHIDQEKGRPDTLTFAHCNGNELEDQLEDINDKDDDTYQPPDDAINEYSNNDFSFDDTDTDGSDDDDDDEDGNAPRVGNNDNNNLGGNNELFDTPAIIGKDMPSHEEIADDQQQQDDDNSVASSSADSQHIKLDTASIMGPRESTEVDVDLGNTVRSGPSGKHRCGCGGEPGTSAN